MYLEKSPIFKRNKLSLLRFMEEEEKKSGNKTSKQSFSYYVALTTLKENKSKHNTDILVVNNIFKKPTKISKSQDNDRTWVDVLMR